MTDCRCCSSSTPSRRRQRAWRRAGRRAAGDGADDRARHGADAGFGNRDAHRRQATVTPSKPATLPTPASSCAMQDVLSIPLGTRSRLARQRPRWRDLGLCRRHPRADAPDGRTIDLPVGTNMIDCNKIWRAPSPKWKPTTASGSGARTTRGSGSLPGDRSTTSTPRPLSTRPSTSRSGSPTTGAENDDNPTTDGGPVSAEWDDMDRNGGAGVLTLRAEMTRRRPSRGLSHDRREHGRPRRSGHGPGGQDEQNRMASVQNPGPSGALHDVGRRRGLVGPN